MFSGASASAPRQRRHLLEAIRALPPGYPERPAQGLSAADSRQGSGLGRVPAATGLGPNSLSPPPRCPRPQRGEIPARTLRRVAAPRHPLRQRPHARVTRPRGMELPGWERAPAKEAKSPQNRSGFHLCSHGRPRRAPGRGGPIIYSLRTRAAARHRCHRPTRTPKPQRQRDHTGLCRENNRNGVFPPKRGLLPPAPPKGLRSLALPVCPVPGPSCCRCRQAGARRAAVPHQHSPRLPLARSDVTGEVAPRTAAWPREGGKKNEKKSWKGKEWALCAAGAVTAAFPPCRGHWRPHWCRRIPELNASGRGK